MNAEAISQKVREWKHAKYAEKYEPGTMDYAFIGSTDRGLYGMALQDGAITQEEHDFAKEAIGEDRWNWSYCN